MFWLRAEKLPKYLPLSCNAIPVGAGFYIFGNFCMKNCHSIKVMIWGFLGLLVSIYIEYIDIWHSWPMAIQHRVFIFLPLYDSKTLSWSVMDWLLCSNTCHGMKKLFIIGQCRVFMFMILPLMYKTFLDLIGNLFRQ